MSGNRRRRARNLLDNAEEQVRRFAGVLSNVLNRERQVAVDNLDSDREYLASESEDSDSIGSSSENSEYSGGSTNRIGDTYTEHRSRRIRSQNIRGGISGLRVRNPHPPSPASEHSDWSIPDENSSRSEDNEIEVITVNPMQRWNRVIVDESFDMPESQVAGDHDPSHSDQPVSPLQTTANNNHSAEPNQPVLSDSDSSQLNIRRRPKRRRTDELATQDEEQACSSKPDLIKVFDSLNNDTGASIDDDADDGCTICYEDFANAGVHRLVSLKCGHFFGQSCIERWIRGEGRTAGCPTCKTKASNKDIRKHYARSIKLTDTSELEALRELNATLHVKVSQLEMESARKDREISDLNRRLKEGVNRVPVVSLPLPCSRPGRMSLTPGKKMALSVSNNGSSRAFDWNGECFAVGVTSPSGNMFQPYAIRKIGWVSSEFRAGPYLPLHSNRIRVVCFSPFESNLILSGGEDKKAVVHILGGSMRRQWKMPNDRQVWAGCWTAPNKVALGLNDGRVLEFDIESESTEPVRDYTQGIGNMPILFIGFDSISSVLIVASFKKVLAFRNDKVYPLLNNIDDQFDKIRSIAFDEGTLSFVATFSPGANSPGISHRLYKIEIDQDSDEVCCVKLGMWITACVQSSTMWNNCLFSYQNGLFSIIYNEDKKRLDVHDWSGKRTDVMMSFSSSSSSCNLASMRTIGGTKDCEKTVILLSELAIYSASFTILE